MKRIFIALLIIIVVVILSLFLAGVFRRPSSETQPVTTEPEGPFVIIVLDPGHGGRDPGAVVGDILEKDVNLEIVKKVRELVEAQPRLKPVLTRTTDVTVDKLKRTQLADDIGAVLYLSIHVNAFDDPEVNGAETWVDDTRPPGDESWKLADSVQNALVAATGARDRGIRSQELYLQHTTLPAVSVEVGFLTSLEERAKLLDSAYQDRIAQGILEGILDYLNTATTLLDQSNGTTTPQSD
ncbi:N-acetylmuramoyl-L-alanine amidase [Candidatus Bipolaricaulota bacterium]|nr:N-acetylmuramoyl-L-alanine amidase [Candidatus Bipolaricaulota bacterium]